MRRPTATPTAQPWSGALTSSTCWPGGPLPEEDYYEEFTQLDNGVGMLRLLRQEFRRGLDLMEAEEMERTVPFSIATGVSAAPFLTELVELARKKCGKIEETVYPIRNDFFGETIVVAGLVTGAT